MLIFAMKAPRPPSPSPPAQAGGEQCHQALKPPAFTGMMAGGHEGIL